MIKDILQLGNPLLYQKSTVLSSKEIHELSPIISNLHDTLMDYKKTYGAGRAIAAPQIGYFKRLIYMYIDKPIIFINPTLSFPSTETIEVMDDCMSFPHLLVKVQRYKKCIVSYLDEKGNPQQLELQDDLAELIQHEYDHLDGILATMRAIDEYSFYKK